jgi:hypothetical protein
MRWGLPEEEEGEIVLGRRVRLCYEKVVVARSLLLGGIVHSETCENTCNECILIVPCSPQAGVTTLMHSHDRWWQNRPK